MECPVTVPLPEIGAPPIQDGVQLLDHHIDSSVRRERPCYFAHALANIAAGLLTWTDYNDAKRALERLHRELMDLNPSAARSLEEGMEETLTVHKLRVPDQLRRTLCCTNVIESAFSIVETVCRNVKRWRPGDQIERWVGSGLLVAERQFRKVIGHRQIPLLLSSMATAVSKKSIAKGAAVA